MLDTPASLSLHRAPPRRSPARAVRALARDPVGCVAGLVVLIYLCSAVLAPVLTPANPAAVHLGDRLVPPSPKYWFGTDALGRDLLSRTLYGARVSIIVGVLTVAIVAAAGTVLGLVGGYFRGAFDLVSARLAELLLAFPYLIFAIGLMAFLGPGFWNLVWALSFKGWVEFYRLARGETLSHACRQYVEAARALGSPTSRVLFAEILPNIAHTLFALALLRLGYFMVLQASLSFLGVGIPPSIPSWGSMINEGKDVLFTAWWVSTIPGLALLVLVLALNLLGERLKGVWDPWQIAR